MNAGGHVAEMSEGEVCAADSRELSASWQDYSDASQRLEPAARGGKETRCLLTSIAGASVVDLRNIWNVKHSVKSCVQT